MCLSISLLCLFSVFFIENRSAESSRVALPRLASHWVAFSHVASCRCASQLQNRFYSYQISNKMQQRWSPTPSHSSTPAHTPPHPLTLLEYQPASFCLRLSPSLSLTLLFSLNRAQKSTTIQNKRRQSRTRAAQQQQQQFWTKMPTTTKSARLSAPSLSLCQLGALCALSSLCLCSLSRAQTGFRCGCRCACLWIIIKTAKAKQQQQLQ